MNLIAASFKKKDLFDRNINQRIAVKMILSSSEK